MIYLDYPFFILRGKLQSMAIILSLETSTEACSVALHKEGTLIAYFEVQISKSHSESLTLLIEQITRFSKINLNNIDAIALSMGPGSYTGLRVGTSTAKGLAMALEKPLIAVNTLKSMALEINKTNVKKALLCPMLDARRMEVYCSVYDDQLNEVVETNAKILEGGSFSELLKDRMVLFFGNGSAKFKTVVDHSNAFFITGVVPKALNIGQLAFEAFADEKFENIHTFEPFYLKDFVMRKN
jgi:tRNA threonylcarbamoyladenosine biosynthesis protein TsaB